MYEDPRAHVRPVSHLSWAPGTANRLAAAYSFMEFETQPDNVNPYSYIWDIENPSKALMELKSFSPLMAIEFNPRDPSMLISGLRSGQVCNWDIRTGDKPVQVSHLLHSHRNPANQAVWITSKTNTELFSSSSSGTLKWWDIRYLRHPIDTVVIDLDDPKRGDIAQTVGVSTLSFQPNMGSRLMIGLQNGIVVNMNLRLKSTVEKLATRIRCYCGPVISIDRNPFSPHTYLTIGDWTAKIWADDNREGWLDATCDDETELTGGCWSRSRYSVFFTINKNGILDAYDMLRGLKTPLTTIHVCQDSLTAISPHDNGYLLAVGNRKGSVYLIDSTKGLTYNRQTDKAAMMCYLERCSRYEKLVESRLKELRLTHGSFSNDPFPKETSVSRGRDKGKLSGRERSRSRQIERSKSRHTEKSKGRHTSREKVDAKRKSRAKKGRPTLFDSPVFTEAEAEYFRRVNEESQKFFELDKEDWLDAQSLLQEHLMSRMSQVEETEPEDEPSKDRKAPRRKIRRRRLLRRTFSKPLGKREEELEVEEASAEIDAEAVKAGEHFRRRRGRVLKKSCEVCVPEICCMDMEAKLKRKLAAKRRREKLKRERFPRTRSLYEKEQWYKKLTESVDKIPARSPVYKSRMLRLKNARPGVLRRDVPRARKVAYDWQERARSAQLATFVDPDLKTIEAMKETERETEKLSVPVYEDAEKKRLSSEVKVKIKPADAVQPRQKRDRSKRRAKGKRRGRRRRGGDLSDEAIRQAEAKERAEKLRKMIKEKIREEDEILKKQPEVYPRISAAFVRRLSDDIEDPEKKNLTT